MAGPWVVTAGRLGHVRYFEGEAEARACAAAVRMLAGAQPDCHCVPVPYQAPEAHQPASISNKNVGKRGYLLDTDPAGLLRAGIQL